MKQITKMFLWILILSLLSNKVYAKTVTLTDCEYTDAYESWLLLSDEEKSKVLSPAKCKNEGPFYIKPRSLKATSYENAESFSLKDNYDTGAKSQENLSSCWAFADLNSVETNLLLNGIKNGNVPYEFSVAHEELMLQNDLFNTSVPITREFNSGGYHGLSAAYFFNRLGPILESSVPFSIIYNKVNNGTQVSLADLGNYKAVVSVNDYVEYSTDIKKCDQETIKTIKKYVSTNGGLVAMIDSYDENYSDSARKYYYNSEIPADPKERTYNHEVTIIGWDDNIPASNFRSKSGQTPSRNGAWLVKNSNNVSYVSPYSEHLGDGYDYISYDDTHICTGLAGFYNASTDLDDNVYAYDVLGVTGYRGFENNILYMANKFTKKSSNGEKLKKVTFYSPIAGQNYEILYSANGILDNHISLYSGTTDKIGYTTIDLSNKNKTITNNEFAIIIKYTKNLEYIFLPEYEEVNTSWYLNYKVTTGKSFLSLNGSNWNDLEFADKDENNNDIVKKAYAPIKVYTDNVNSSENIFNINYLLTDGIKSIGKNNDSCRTESNSCQVTLPTINTNSGYRALGWFRNINDDNPVGQAGDNYYLTESMTLYAKAEPIITTYTVTLNFDDGAIRPQNTTLKCNTSAGETSCQVTLPGIEAKNGYDVVGWFNASTGGSRVDESGLTINVSSNINLYARTKAKTVSYTATFSKGNGVSSIATSSSTCTLQNNSNKCSISLPTITVNNDYNILGWYNDTILVGQPGDSYELSSDVTLTAKAELKPKTYTITFNKGTGVSSIATSSSTCKTANGSTKCNIILPEITANSGYTVSGWYNSNNELVGSSGDNYELTSNITLTAKAELNPQKYTVIFRTTDGITSIGKNSLSCNLENNNQKCSITLPTIDASNDYNILGWFTSEAANNPIGQPGDTYELSSNITLYAKAQLKSKKYTATFEFGNGISAIATSSSNCSTQNGSNKCTITLPKITVKSGYKSLGWYSANTGGEKVGDQDNTYELSKNITLYARAELINSENNETVFTITLKAADNNAKINKSSLNCTTTENSCKVTLPKIDTSDDYSVLGWYTAPSGGTKVGNPEEEYTVAEDKTLYARVIKNPSGDPSVTNEDKIIVNKNPNNSDYDGNNVSYNPGTGNKKIVISLIIIMSLMGGLYYNYRLKSSNIINN